MHANSLTPRRHRGVRRIAEHAGAAFATFVAALLCPTVAHAGSNAGAQVYLSWNATSQVSDTNPAAVNYLYIRAVRSGGLTFSGAEIAISWDPATNFAGTCFAHLGTAYKTSSGATCTYLNRGTATPIVVTDDISEFHVAWSNTAASTGCTSGAIIQITFETDGCVQGQGCFALNYAALLDASGRIDVATISNAIVTIGGGGSHTCDSYTPVRSTTWGAVKALWHP